MTGARPRIVLIAAVAQNGVIGDRGRLPWHLPGDLAHFRRETWEKPVIFGRKTLASIGRALPGRFCIAVSRDPAFRLPGVAVARDLADAYARAQAEAARTGATEIMVAGGATVYAAALGQADELRLTAVELAPAGDTQFPPVASDVWREVERLSPVPHQGDDGPYAFTRLLRKHPLVA